MGVIDCVDGSSIVYFGIKPSHRKLITSENNIGLSLLILINSL